MLTTFDNFFLNLSVKMVKSNNKLISLENRAKIKDNFYILFVGFRFNISLVLIFLFCLIMTSKLGDGVRRSKILASKII